jgi:uncharacterized protein YjbI with pentapeptide repeats
VANEEHVKILKQGVEVWNAWRIANPTLRPDLYGAHLHFADLSHAILSNADLRDADLSAAGL